MAEADEVPRSLEISLDQLAYEGRAIGRSEGLVVFTDYGCPGDRVRVRIFEQKKRFATAVIEELLEPSPLRREPGCPYFGDGLCGGCQWRHVNYEEQIRQKTRILRDQFERIGRIENVPAVNFNACPQYDSWRMSLRFHIGTGNRLGFHRRRSNDVIEIESCPAATPGVNSLLAGLRPLLAGCEPLNGMCEIGFSDDERRGVITLTLRHKAPAGLENRLLEALPELAGIVTVTPFGRHRFGHTALEFRHSAGGREYVWKQEADSFWQVNHAMNAAVKNTLAALLERERSSGGLEHVVEIFGGSGNFTQVLASYAGRVDMIESDAAACLQCRRNLLTQSAQDYEVIAGDAAWALSKIAQRREKIDLVFLDPPRDGFSAGIKDIVRLAPRTIVYLSCGPSDTARDVQMLCNAGWRLEELSGFDFFPQTFHIESLSVLRR